MTTDIEIGSLVEWYDKDDHVNRMGIVRAIEHRELRVSGRTDPLAEETASIGWSVWILNHDVRTVNYDPLAPEGLQRILLDDAFIDVLQQVVGSVTENADGSRTCQVLDGGRMSEALREMAKSFAEHNPELVPKFAPRPGDRVSYKDGTNPEDEGPLWLDVWVVTDKSVFGRAKTPGIGEHDSAWDLNHDWYRIGAAEHLLERSSIEGGHK